MKLFPKTLLITILILNSAAISSAEKSYIDINVYPKFPSSEPEVHDKPSTYLKSLISYYQDINIALNQTKAFRSNASDTIHSIEELEVKYQNWLEAVVPRVKEFLANIPINKSKRTEVAKFIKTIRYEEIEYEEKLFKFQLNYQEATQTANRIHFQKEMLMDASEAILAGLSVLSQSGVFINDSVGEDKSRIENFDLSIVVSFVDILENYEDCMEELEQKGATFDQRVFDIKTTLCKRQGKKKDDYIKRYEQNFKYFLPSVVSKLNLLNKTNDEMFEEFNKIDVALNNVQAKNEHNLDQFMFLMDEVRESHKKIRDEL